MGCHNGRGVLASHHWNRNHRAYADVLEHGGKYLGEESGSSCSLPRETLHAQFASPIPIHPGVRRAVGAVDRLGHPGQHDLQACM